MAAPTRPQARSARTRAAILAAAEPLFAERGFAATRLEDVAARVGIRRASLFYYWPDKAALYDAVLASVLGELFARTSAALEAPGGLAERVEAAVSAWVDTVAARPALARLLLREAADATPEAPPALLRHTAPFVEMAQRVTRAHSGEAARAALEIDPIHLASTIAGATVFFVAAMPALAPGAGFDPLDAAELAAHKREVLRITRRLLGQPAAARLRAPHAGPGAARRGAKPRARRRPRSG